MKAILQAVVDRMARMADLLRVCIAQVEWYRQEHGTDPPANINAELAALRGGLDTCQTQVLAISKKIAAAIEN